MSYTYSENSGITLNVIKSSPNNIILREINRNVVGSSYYGINGGFYYRNDQLSIAVNNDIPVRGVKGGYGSGWFNEKYARGTLVWDKQLSLYSIQVVRSADDLVVYNRNAYWAQGGISMNLQDDGIWEQQANEENMPNIYGRTTRTALLYNSGLNIWLVTTEENCTAEEFRYAIKYQVGSGTLVDGIFLDGGGSTQMQCSHHTNNGDGRSVVQMVALINK